MRVFIITCVFPPEPLTSAMTSADLAEEMVKRGHDVTVFAPFPNRPSGYVHGGYTRKWKQVEYRSGYKVVHCWHILSRKSTFLSRVAENISFALTSTWQIIREKPPDVVYMNTWVFFSQCINSWLLKQFRVPIVCSIQDIYPESLIDKGMLKQDSWISRFIRYMDSCHLNRCSIVTTISSGMVELLKSRGVPSEKVHLILNWMDDSIFSPQLPMYGVFRQRVGIGSNVFLAIFAGSLTMSAGIDLYVKVAEKLSHRSDIHILLVGDGSNRKEVEEDIASLGLNNIQVIYPLKREEVPYVHAAADVLLMSLSGEMSQSAAPSKQVAYMLSGRPVVASMSKKNTAAKILIEADAGFVLPPNDASAVADLLIQLTDDRSALQRLGMNARRYAENNFSKNTNLRRLANLLESLVR